MTKLALTEAEARAVVAQWYRLFNQPVQGDMKTLQEQILTADYESCWGYLPGECWGRDASIKVVGGFAKSIGSAPALGAGSRRFKSSHPDQSFQPLHKHSSFQPHSFGRVSDGLARSMTQDFSR